MSLADLASARRHCLHLDGKGYGSCGNPTHLQITGTGSMAACVRITQDTIRGSQDFANILAHGHDGVSEVFLRFNCQNLRVEAGSWQAATDFTALCHVAVTRADLGKWMHVCAVFDGSSWTMYKNAVAEPAVPSRQGFVKVANSEWAIGSKGGGGSRVFIGHIADVQLWTVPLTPVHVASFISDESPPIPRPVARWMMDDGGDGKRAQDSSASIDPCHATLKGSASIKPSSMIKSNDAPSSSSSSSSSSGAGPTGADRQLYSVLEVQPDSSAADIKKAYHRLARERHPDRNGNTPESVAAFQELEAAYKVLSDPVKRRTYDNGGEKALQQEQQRPTSKAATAQARVSITLEEAFFGASKTLSFQRSRPCGTCAGRGLIRSGPDCMRCNGNGVTVATVQVLMGLQQQVQMKCAACSGTGVEGAQARACGGCSGRKIVAEAAHVQYYIKPGTVDGGVCHVRGEGSCDPGEEPGDIQLKISVQKHAVYTLKGSDLVCTLRVALSELLRGRLVLSHKHIDGRTYSLTAPTSPAPQPGSVYIAEGLGMPIASSPDRGRLAVVISVVFPDAMPALAELASSLHAACGSSERFAGLTGQEEEVLSRPVSEREMEEQFGRVTGGGGGSATQEDEEADRKTGGGGAGCPVQ